MTSAVLNEHFSNVVLNDECCLFMTVDYLWMLIVCECWLFINDKCCSKWTSFRKFSPWKLLICCDINFAGWYCVTMEIADAHYNVYVQGTF